jgi:hypothetical protein
MPHDFYQAYHPTQPGVGALTSGVSYSEEKPHPALSKYVACYWRLQSTQQLSESFAYRVVPDGCIDIFCDAHRFNEFRVMGFSTSPAMFEVGRCFSYAGIRFLPAAFPFLFNVDASTFTNSDEDLFDVVPALAKKLSQQFDRHQHSGDLKEVFDSILLNKLKSFTRSEDKRLYNAVNIVLRSHGNVHLAADLHTGISPRQLRRLFQFYIGDTPKAFSKVVRFQHFLKLQSLPTPVANNKIFLDAGYYDQPHFNKEFKTFFGLTPGEALLS